MTGTRKRLIALVVAAIALTISGDVIPRAILASMEKLDVRSSASFRTKPSRALLLDVQAWRDRSPNDCPELRCYQTTDEVTETTEVYVGAVKDPKEAIITARSTLGQAEWKDSVRVTRHSTFPVLKPNGEVAWEGSLAGVLTGRATGEFTREGVHYRFPSTTEQKSYPYFDPWSLQSAPIDYVDKSQRYFLYHQDVAPVALGPDSPTLLHAEPLSGPAGAFYSPQELATLGIRDREPLTLTPYYAVNRTLTVEPASGEIINKREHRVVVLARSEEEAHKTAVEEPEGRVLYRADTSWDDATVAAQEATSGRVVDTEQRMAVLSWVSKTLRLAVALAAVAVVIRHRRAR